MNDFEQFAAAMREQESGNDYSVVNKEGYMGAYQFGKERLYDLGYSLDGYAPKGKPRKTVLPKSIFLSDHFLQEKLFRIHCSLWKTYANKHYAEFVGSMACGIEITISGLVAGLHLLGPGSDARPGVTQFLQRGIVGKDGNKTPITLYLSKFSNYDFATIK